MTPRQRAKQKKAALAAPFKRFTVDGEVQVRPAKSMIVKLDEARQPWERQPKESNQGYAAFQIYRDLPLVERKHTVVARAMGLSTPAVWAHATKHSWIERAAAWDLYLDRAKLAQTEKYQLEMAARHADIAMTMLARVRDRLDQINFKKLDPKVVAQWLDIGVKVERLARGLTPESTINTVNTLNLNLRQMSEEEIIKEIAKEGLRSGRDRAIDVSSIEIPTDANPS